MKLWIRLPGLCLFLLFVRERSKPHEDRLQEGTTEDPTPAGGNITSTHTTGIIDQAL